MVIKENDVQSINAVFLWQQRQLEKISRAVFGTSEAQSSVSAKKETGSLAAEIINAVYPVGSIYMSINDVSPSSLFGGKWERIEDRFLVSAGEEFQDEGGQKSITLNSENIPRHSHGMTHYHDRGNMEISGWVQNVLMDDGTTMSNSQALYLSAGTRTRSWSGASGDAMKRLNFQASRGWSGRTSAPYTAQSGGSSMTNTGNYGGDAQGNTKPIETLPPYMAVYMWKRTE